MELEVIASGSGSPRSSLRTTSARIDHDVILAAVAFLAFAVRTLVGRAEEFSFDQDVSAFLDGRSHTCCAVSGNLGRPGATTYDPMHFCLLPFALLSVSWDVGGPYDRDQIAYTLGRTGGQRFRHASLEIEVPQIIVPKAD
jgi:hypothetical protein